MPILILENNRLGQKRTASDATVGLRKTQLKWIGKQRMSTRKGRLESLNETVSQLFSACRKVTNPELMVYEGWTVKDVLGHITYWHESFARNVADLANDKKPTPLRGSYRELNQRCFAEFGSLAIEDILLRFERAHEVIQENIFSAQILLIPYRIGSRDYPPEEHLQIVNNHIQEHIKDIAVALR